MLGLQDVNQGATRNGCREQIPLPAGCERPNMAVFDAILAPNVEIGYWRALLHSIII